MSHADNSLFKQVLAEGTDLNQRLRINANNLFKELKREHTDPKELSRHVVARAFLLSSSNLTSEIIDAVLRGHVGLAIIGHRTLLEHLVNVNYIFDHPQHQSDLVWVSSICEDLFARTSDLKANKNKLNNVTLQQRMKEIGREDLYHLNYASLSDYSHLTLRQNLLYIPPGKPKISIALTSQSLGHLVGIVETIAKFFAIQWDKSLWDEVEKFSNQYEEPEDPLKS